MHFSSNWIPQYLYKETLSILCPVRMAPCRTVSATSLALENNTHLDLFALRTNFRLKRESCSLSKACWRIVMALCEVLAHQYTRIYSEFYTFDPRSLIQSI